MVKPFKAGYRIKDIAINMIEHKKKSPYGTRPSQPNHLENKGGISSDGIAAPVLGDKTLAMLASKSPRRKGLATYSSMLYVS
jgi:hypothetical protein